MNGTDIAFTMLRAAHVAALISVFGTLVFTAVVADRLPATPAQPALDIYLGRLGRGGILLASGLGMVWFVVQAAAIAGAHSLRETVDAVPPVLLETQFGQLLLVRFGLLLALLPLSLVLWERPLCRTRRMLAAPRHFALPTAIVLAGAALGLQAATSHAGAMGGAAGLELLVAEVLHLLAAGAWLGGLLPLLIVLATMPPASATVALKRFFPLGLVGVLVIAVTAVLQAIALVGSIPALVGTAYGRLALLKLILFMLLLVFASLNRFVLGARPGLHLRRSIVGETAVAMLVVVAAGSMAHLVPGLHEQAIWPFAWRLTSTASGGLVAAYPSSFFVSPTGFDAAAIVRGERLYLAGCAGCHGVMAQGNGPSAPMSPIVPPDLTTQRVFGLGDGDLFWFVGHAATAPDEARWDMVDYLRARNRGEFVRTGGQALPPLRAPRFNAVCADGQAIGPDAMRGKVLRIVVPRTTPERRPTEASTRAATLPLTISLSADAALRPDPSTCMAQPEAVEAFAILLGTTQDALAGTQLLIDPNGWLRARWRPGQPGGWATPELLLARTQALADHPLPSGAVPSHAHQH